jgi:hypothetical protein
MNGISHFAMNKLNNYKYILRKNYKHAHLSKNFVFKSSTQIIFSSKMREIGGNGCRQSNCQICVLMLSRISIRRVKAHSQETISVIRIGKQDKK